MTRGKLVSLYALLTVDNAQSHVTAFRPISEAARSWSDDNVECQSCNSYVNDCMVAEVDASNNGSSNNRPLLPHFAFSDPSGSPRARP